MSVKTKPRRAQQGTSTQGTTLLDKWLLFQRIARDRKLGATDIVIAGLLLGYLNTNDRLCCPHIETVAVEAGKSIRTVKDSIEALRKRRWLTPGKTIL